MTRAEVPADLSKPTDAALAAFDDLRQALLAPPILAPPKAKGQIIVDVDACADQLGCTLLQSNLTVLDYRFAIGAVDSAQLRRIIPQRNASALASCGAYSSSDTSSMDIAS